MKTRSNKYNNRNWKRITSLIVSWFPIVSTGFRRHLWPHGLGAPTKEEQDVASVHCQSLVGHLPACASQREMGASSSSLHPWPDSRQNSKPGLSGSHTTVQEGKLCRLLIICDFDSGPDQSIKSKLRDDKIKTNKCGDQWYVVLALHWAMITDQC